MLYLWIAPVFAYNISWVLPYINPIVSQNLSSNHFTYTMIGKCIMPFVQWRMGNWTVCYNCLIVTNMKLLALTGTLRYRNVVLKSMIWSTAILTAVNSDPKVAVSTVTCRFEYQSINVWLQRWSIPVTDLPVRMACYKLASLYVTVVTQLPRGSGDPAGINSYTFPYTVWHQSKYWSGRLPRSGINVGTRTAALENFLRYPYMRFSLSKCPCRGAEQKRDIVMVAVCMSNLPRETAHWRQPIIVQYY
jgi:hypothetical protein